MFQNIITVSFFLIRALGIVLHSEHAAKIENQFQAISRNGLAVETGGQTLKILELDFEINNEIISQTMKNKDEVKRFYNTDRNSF